MADRYNRVFVSDEKLYATGSPVLIVAGALLCDNKTGEMIAQLKFRNINQKSIKMIRVEIVPRDTMGRTLGTPVCFQYLDLKVERDVDFGSKQPIPIPDKATRSFTARVIEVGFTDNSLCTNIPTSWEPLPAPAKIGDILRDPELTKQFQLDFGDICNYQATEVKDLWYCTCGKINRTGEGKCYRCRRSFADFENIDIAKLTQNTNARLAKEKAEKERKAIEEAEQRRIAEEKRVAEAMRKKKILTVTASCIATVAACIALFQLTIKVIIPNIHYQSAVSLMNSGQYSEAIAAFEDLGEYKDSSIQIKECHYLEAVALKENGEYVKAIAVFNNIYKYRSEDCLVQIEECNYLKNAQNYSLALDCIDNEDYTQAITILALLGNYEDSPEMLKKAKYRKAVEDYSNARYSEAASTFKNIKGYQDSLKYYSASILKMMEAYANNAQYDEVLDLYRNTKNEVNESSRLSMRHILYDCAVALFNQGANYYEQAERIFRDYTDGIEDAEKYIKLIDVLAYDITADYAMYTNFDITNALMNMQDFAPAKAILEESPYREIAAISEHQGLYRARINNWLYDYGFVRIEGSSIEFFASHDINGEKVGSYIGKTNYVKLDGTRFIVKTHSMEYGSDNKTKERHEMVWWFEFDRNQIKTGQLSGHVYGSYYIASSYTKFK